MKNRFLKTLGLGLAFTSVLAVSGCTSDIDATELHTQLNSISQSLEKTKEGLTKERMAEILVLAQTNFLLNENGIRDNMIIKAHEVALEEYDEDIFYTYHFYNDNDKNEFLYTIYEEGEEKNEILTYELYTGTEEGSDVYHFSKSGNDKSRFEADAWSLEAFILHQFGSTYTVSKLRDNIVDYKLLDNGNYQITSVTYEEDSDYEDKYEVTKSVIEITIDYKFVKYEQMETDSMNDGKWDLHPHKYVVSFSYGTVEGELIKTLLTEAEETPVEDGSL